MGLEYLVPRQFKTKGKKMQSLWTYTSTGQVLLWLSFSKLIYINITENVNPWRPQCTPCSTPHFHSRLYLYHLSHSNCSWVRSCPICTQEKRLASQIKCMVWTHLENATVLGGGGNMDDRQSEWTCPQKQEIQVSDYMNMSPQINKRTKHKFL